MNEIYLGKIYRPLLIYILFIGVPQATASEPHTGYNSPHPIELRNPQFFGQSSTNLIAIERLNKPVIEENLQQDLNKYILLHRRWMFTRNKTNTWHHLAKNITSIKDSGAPLIRK